MDRKVDPGAGGSKDELPASLFYCQAVEHPLLGRAQSGYPELASQPELSRPEAPLETLGVHPPVR